jgi:hypothetical protein
MPEMAKADDRRLSRIDRIKFFEQLLFQVATRCLFDCAPLGSYRFLLRLAFSSRPSFDRSCQMRNFRATRTDFSLLWLCVRIHRKV